MILTILPSQVAAFTRHRSYAATPATAAYLALVPPKSGEHVLIRIDRAGRYATVLTRGDSMEGSIVTSPILVEKFSFGWQPLDILNSRCNLDDRAISLTDRRTLMAGMPKMSAERACAGDVSDFGTPAQIEAVRLLMSGPLVPFVAVSGNFAKGDWFGGGGGETLFRKNGAGWTFVTGGGGAMGTADMIEHHVPQSRWCDLRVYDAKCARKP